MKAKFTLLAVMIAAFFTGFGQQQPTNGSFETWTSGINPDGWVDVETLLGAPSSFLTFKDTSHTVGSFSVKILADSIAGVTQGQVIGGLISLGTGALSNTGSPQFTGVPFTSRPDTLIFDFKYSTPGLDTAAVFLSLTKQFTDQVIGVGFALTPVAGWTHVAIPLGTFYNDANSPDTIQLQFSASNAQVSIVGSALNVDGLRFGYASVASTLTATITAGGPTTYCTGDSVALTANTGTGYTYQWNLNTNPITGATGSSYWAKGSGSYTVTIDSSTASATSNAIVVTDTTCHGVGINNIAAATLSIYPNPASSLLNITANENLAGFNLQMYDVVGRLVASQILEGNNNAINVARLSNGTYIIRVTDKDNGVVAQSKFNVIK